MDLRKEADSVKRDLQSKRCPEHGKSADISVTGSSDSPSISIKACCETFKKRLVGEANEKLASKAKEAMQDAIKNIFKKF